MKNILISLSVLTTLLISGCTVSNQISECQNGKTFSEIHETLKKLIEEKGIETELGDSQIDLTYLSYTVGDIWMSLGPYGGINIVDNSENGDQYSLSNVNGEITIDHPGGKSKSFNHEIEHLCNKVLNTINF